MKKIVMLAATILSFSMLAATSSEAGRRPRPITEDSELYRASGVTASMSLQAALKRCSDLYPSGGWSVGWIPAPYRTGGTFVCVYSAELAVHQAALAEPYPTGKNKIQSIWKR